MENKNKKFLEINHGILGRSTFIDITSVRKLSIYEHGGISCPVCHETFSLIDELPESVGYCIECLLDDGSCNDMIFIKKEDIEKIKECLRGQNA